MVVYKSNYPHNMFASGVMYNMYKYTICSPVDMFIYKHVFTLALLASWPVVRASNSSAKGPDIDPHHSTNGSFPHTVMGSGPA